MNAKITIVIDPDLLDIIAKKGNLSVEEVKESLEQGCAKELKTNIMFSEVYVEVTE